MCLGHVQFAAQPRLVARLGNFERLLLRKDVLFGNGQSRLTAPHLQIVPGNFGKQRHQHITAVFNGNREIGIRRLHRSPHAAKHIDFPTGIETRPERG